MRYLLGINGCDKVDAKKLTPLAFALFLIALPIASSSGKESKLPLLILQITVDQLRGDLPTRYYDRLDKGGLRQRAPCAQAPPLYSQAQEGVQVIARSVLGGLHHVYDLAA